MSKYGTSTLGMFNCSNCIQWIANFNHISTRSCNVKDSTNSENFIPLDWHDEDVSETRFHGSRNLCPLPAAVDCTKERSILSTSIQPAAWLLVCGPNISRSEVRQLRFNRNYWVSKQMRAFVILPPLCMQACEWYVGFSPHLICFRLLLYWPTACVASA